MVTALPPNSGGYITTSFTQNDIGKTNAVKLFTMSSKARKALATKHTQYVGYYGTTSKPNKGTRITPIFLPIPPACPSTPHLSPHCRTWLFNTYYYFP